MYDKLLLKVEAANALLASSGAAGKDEKRFFRHENSHDYQSQLVARLNLPATDTNKLTKANTDPPYTQALMFKSNDAAGGYVVGAEDDAAYQKQPMEDHSWSAGPDLARRLNKAIA